MNFSQVQAYDSSKPLLSIDGGAFEDGFSLIRDCEFIDTDFMYFSNGNFEIEDVKIMQSKGFVGQNLNVTGKSKLQ